MKSSDLFVSQFCKQYAIPSTTTFMVWSCIIIALAIANVLCCTTTGPWFNIKTPSYQYRKSHCGDKTVVRSSYLHNGVSYTGKMTSLYWTSPLTWNKIYLILEWTLTSTHCGMNKMAAILQETFSNSFFCVCMFERKFWNFTENYT